MGQVHAPTTNVCKISRLCGPISSLSLDLSPLNLVSCLYFKVLFQAVSMVIRVLLFMKSCREKTVEGSQMPLGSERRGF